MPTPGTCANCGAPLAVDVRKGFCPKCLFAQAQAGLLGFNMEGDFGDYELLEEIGRGGMGVVYRARQRSLDRVVAIKRMVFGPGSIPELVKRFRAEAVSAAALRHPNIVAIHEVGVHEGQHFFVMDYVQGQSLAHLATAGPLPIRRAAGYLKTLAEAVHYAHERGILHRDLKPSNVLIDEQDQPRIVDFGLARRFEGASELTVTGQVLGSPHYLPPEQATAQRGRVSPRTDVYGLGATLYHLLTGRPPFQAESLAQTLDLVLHTEPVAPRLLNPSVPRDLETICLKCLEKEPAKRYPTALALAEELDRFLDGRPILARPIGPLGRVNRWCRRNPLVAMGAGATLLSLLLGLAGVSWQWRQAEAQRQRAEQNAYVLAMNGAQQALSANNPNRTLELLDSYRPGTGSKSDLRGFEWRYLWQQCQTEAEAVIGTISGGVRSLEVSPDSRWLVASSQSGAASLWDLSTGEESRLLAGRGVWAFAAFSPDSRRLLVTDQSQESWGTVTVWDLEARERLAPIRDPNPLGPIVFSPDGQWLGLGVNIATNARGLVLLDAKTYKKVGEGRSSTGMITGDAFHGFDWVFVPHRQSTISSENDPDRRLAFWDFGANRAPVYSPAHGEAITAMAISPDGQILATGAGWTETSVKLWEIPSFRPVGELRGHTGWITALRFSPDGQTLASASADQSIRLWNAPTQKPIRIFARLPTPVWRVCFTLDGRKLLSGDSEGTIRRWPVEAQPVEVESGFWRLRPGLEQLTVAPDGRHFGGIRQGRICVGDAQPKGLAQAIPDLGTNNSCVLFSVDGQSLFAGTETGEVQVWSLAGQKVLQGLRARAEPAWEMHQDRSGRRLLLLQAKRALVWLPYHVSVWSTRDWRQELTFELSAAEYPRAVSPDGRWLATGRLGGPVRLWSLVAPLRTNTLAFSGSIIGTAFSADGRRLAAVAHEGAVKIWELPSGRVLKEFRARSQSVFALAFSPDSRRLATAGEGEEAIKLWDVATWQELLTFRCPGETLAPLFLSADGNQLAARDSQGDVLIWRVPSFAEIDEKERTRRLP